MASGSQGARLKTNRARRHLDELRAEVAAFGARGPFSIERHDDDPGPGDVTYRLSIGEDIPNHLAPIIGDVLHGLRTALDVLVEASILHAGGEPNPRTGFPIAKTETAFEDLIESRLGEASNRTYRIVRTLQPYEAGNPLLWALHRLNISDKHRVLVPVAAGHRSVAVQPFAAMEGMDPKIAEFAAGFTIHLRPADRQVPLSDGDVLFAAPASAGSHAAPPEYRFDLAFWGTEAMEGEPIPETLEAMYACVARILDLFDRFVFATATP